MSEGNEKWFGTTDIQQIIKTVGGVSEAKAKNTTDAIMKSLRQAMKEHRTINFVRTLRINAIIKNPKRGRNPETNGIRVIPHRRGYKLVLPDELRHHLNKMEI